MSIFSDISQLVERFGKWLKGAFKASEKVYADLTEEEKKTATWAYGVIAIVNQSIDDTPDSVIGLVQAKYPELSKDVLHGFLDRLLNEVHAVDGNVPLTLEDGIVALQKYLSKFQGQTWAQISQALGNVLAVLFSPDTPIQKFIAVAELVYQMIVKPHVEAK